jgi:trigger factor
LKVKDKSFETDGSVEEVVLTLTASVEEVNESSKKFFAQISQREIPGFRKGKAPRAVLEQSVGGHANAMGGVAELLINELAFAAIDSADVIFIGEPTFNVDGQLEESEPFTFTVSGRVAPKIELDNLDPVEIELPAEKATKQDVENGLAEIQDYYHSFEEVADANHVATEGDYIMATVTVTNDGKPLPGLSAASRMIGLGQGTMPESFDAGVYGAKAGDVLEFDFEAKDAEGNSEYGDGNLHAVVELKSFRKIVIPEIDDDLALKVGCANVDDMRAQLERTINMQKEKDLPKLKVDRTVDAMLERVDADIPDYYVDFIRQDVTREYMQSLEAQGTNLQEWMIKNAVSGDDLKSEIVEEAKRRAAIDCILEAVFIKAGLEISDSDIDAMFESDENPEEIKNQWAQANRMSDVRKMCRQQKATEWLCENAKVTEEK